MERRALIAVVISLVILVLYQEVVIKRLYAPPPEPAPAEPTGFHGAPATEPEPAPPSTDTLREAPAAQTAEAPVEGRDVTVDTDLYRAVFTTAGARLKSLKLKTHRTTVAQDSPPQELVLPSASGALPLGIELRGAQGANDVAVTYQVDRQRLDLSADATGTVTFTGLLEGATIRKRFELQGDRYLLGLQIDVDNAPAEYTEVAITWDGGRGGVDPIGGEVLFDSVLALQGTKLQRQYFKNLDSGEVLDGNIAWAGLSGNYFLAALVPDGGSENALRVWMKRFQETVVTQLLMPQGEFSTHVELFIGPKDIDRLDAAGHSLRRAVDLGWFTFVALPMLQVLRHLNRFTGNYGVDIILLTILIKVLFYPLTKKSLQSMREMQKLQPEMAKIRERLKDKPEEMNKAVMEMYKRHKVNPLGGCLPMVLQMPVFIGLYQALRYAVELRHAPFLGWINDLSAPDRLGSVQLPFVEHAGFPVLTLAMGASMFLQQWMTPSAADPTQQRMMLLMPVVFTFMFINFPAGLTLYWLVNNILTIAQQYVMNRTRQ